MRLDLDCTEFAGGVVVETAPAIVFGACDEFASDWVAVNVADLLYELSRGEGVEVVIRVCQNFSRVPLRSFEDWPLTTRRNEARESFGGSLASRWTCSGMMT